MSNSQKNVLEKLKEVGLSVDEVKEWLVQSSEEAESENTPEQNTDCNILFLPAGNTENTKVYFLDEEQNGYLINGIVRAGLEYDPDLGFPILKLEIANPIIPDFNS
jgi:hypothetical protein